MRVDMYQSTASRNAGDLILGTGAKIVISESGSSTDEVFCIELVDEANRTVTWVHAPGIGRGIVALFEKIVHEENRQ